MSQARCTLQVRGLDCPTEVDAAPRGTSRPTGGHRPGIRPDSRHDDGGLRRGSRRSRGTGPSDRRADRLADDPCRDNPSDPPRRGGRGMSAGFSPRAPGWRCRLGLAFSWLGPALGPEATGRGAPGPGGLRVGCRHRGNRAVPQGGAEPAAAAVRYRRADGAGDPGCDGPGTVGRGRDRGLLVWAVGIAGGAEPGPRAAVDPGAPGARPADGRADRARWHRSAGARRARCAGAIGSWSAPATRSRSMARSPRDARASTRRRSRASRSRSSARRAIRSTPGRSTATGRWRSRRPGPVGDAVISRVVAQVRAAQAGRAPIERRISRFAAVYTPLVVGLSLLVMLVPPLIVIRRAEGKRVGLGRLARLVWTGPGRAGDRLSLSRW